MPKRCAAFMGVLSCLLQMADAGSIAPSRKPIVWSRDQLVHMGRVLAIQRDNVDTSAMHLESIIYGWKSERALRSSFRYSTPYQISRRFNECCAEREFVHLEFVVLADLSAELSKREGRVEAWFVDITIPANGDTSGASVSIVTHPGEFPKCTCPYPIGIAVTDRYMSTEPNPVPGPNWFVLRMNSNRAFLDSTTLSISETPQAIPKIYSIACSSTDGESIDKENPRETILLRGKSLGRGEIRTVYSSWPTVRDEFSDTSWTFLNHSYRFSVVRKNENTKLTMSRDGLTQTIFELKSDFVKPKIIWLGDIDGDSLMDAIVDVSRTTDERRIQLFTTVHARNAIVELESEFVGRKN